MQIAGSQKSMKNIVIAFSYQAEALHNTPLTTALLLPNVHFLQHNVMVSIQSYPWNSQLHDVSLPTVSPTLYAHYLLHNAMVTFQIHP
ncbi:uncharacterized protein VTP21DRAFT_8153 [Calcarisporiella thermophila]|uniref:uncharacterized protein n=1 Tax=Calcarisporiella thermophila TaxID=911321 RepID=UPI00374296EF